MNKRQNKKNLKKWTRRFQNSRKNGEIISIITQSLIGTNIVHHKPYVKIVSSDDNKALSAKHWL